jgi:hypothetical protein
MKGKVEKPFYYVQEHLHLLRGLEVKELSEFDRKLEEFMDKYNERDCRGIHTQLV